MSTFIIECSLLVLASLYDMTSSFVDFVIMIHRIRKEELS